ncbi:hypothetical protein N431DRAFT_491042 [Stipitochalara longipes BDJ]|nr:hypothetical protein N431DRAFT_491042 [Stipitochalara longipes BDJ]
MPPPHRLLASRLQGYVCRACLSKSKINLQQQRLWLSRNATNGERPAPSKRASQHINPQEAVIRLFEQAPDGTRVEIPTDFLNGMEEEYQDYENEGGKSLEELASPVDFESLVDDGRQHSPYDPMLGGESLEDMTKSTEELEALVERLENIDFSTLSAEDRDRLREELLKSATTDESPLTRVVSDSASPPAPQSKSIAVPTKVPSVPIELFTGGDRNHIAALNQAIKRKRKAAGRPDASRSLKKRPPKDVWQCYLLCRNTIRSCPQALPPCVWDELWDECKTGNGSNMDRMERIKILGEDMSSANIPLSPPRQLLYVESIFVSGDKSIALKEWEALLQTSKELFHSRGYYELGVRMLCQIGDVEHAFRTAEVWGFHSQDPNYFRILLPIIQACLTSKDELSVQRAWALYIRMQYNLDSQMTMEDYDAVISMFLAANQPDLALGAFKDMMLTGSTLAPSQNSLAQYKKVVGVDQLGSIAIEKRELDWENSRTLANLPAQFNNRFFFGSWIKKLIGEGKLDAAKQVFDLMQARRMKPDAKHMNGLIGAWLRQGYERSRILAEDMAWKMIRARLDFVEGRNSASAYNVAKPARVVGTNNLASQKPLVLTPSATIETFAILIEQYRRRQKSELIPGLLDAMRSAQIRPSTYFMNQLLLCNSRAHKTGRAWDTYYTLSTESGVQPDVDTYKILWDLMKKATSPLIGRPSARPVSFTTCRRLFADMMERGGKEDLTQETYDSIILSFSHALDQPGIAVALWALQRRFGMYPTMETIRIIMLQLTRLGLTNDVGSKPRRLNLRSSLTQERLAHVTGILETFRDQRIEVLLQQGIVFDELEGDAKAEEMLLLVSDVLRYVAHARIAAEERHNYNAAIASEIAAEQMGVPEYVPWTAHDDGKSEAV